MSTFPALGVVLTRAVTFLANERDENGLWSDFDTMAGCSIDWVSGHVATAIAGVPGTWLLRQTACRALLARQRRSGGWGYHENIPEDADSTAWVLRGLAGGTFVSPHVRHAALLFLTAHQVGGGGYTTFRLLEAIGDVIGEESRQALLGWGSAHTCVSANVVLALLEAGVPLRWRAIAAALDYLEEARRNDGLWDSYWWIGPAFATYHALLAITLGRRSGPPMSAQTARTLLALQNDDGAWGDAPERSGPSHAVATALAILSLSLAPQTRAIAGATSRAVRRLADWQRDDGSWPTVPILRIPDAHVLDPHRVDGGHSRPGTNIVVADQRRIYTTAIVMHALSVYQRISAAQGATRE